LDKAGCSCEPYPPLTFGDQCSLVTIPTGASFAHRAVGGTTPAAGIDRDHYAVIAGLALRWNSGVVEGQVNRIEMLKRQMFGRAGFSLLRQRVLPVT